MFGGPHRRFAAIIFNTFEAAVLLLGLCCHADFPFDQSEKNTLLLGVNAGRLTHDKALQAAKQALRRLQMLAEVSEMAASRARVVTQLFIKATQEQTSKSMAPTGPSGSSSGSSPLSNLLGLDDDGGCWASGRDVIPSWISESIPTIAQADSYSMLQEWQQGFVAPWTIGDPL